MAQILINGISSCATKFLSIVTSHCYNYVLMKSLTVILGCATGYSVLLFFQVRLESVDPPCSYIITRMDLLSNSQKKSIQQQLSQSIRRIYRTSSLRRALSIISVTQKTGHKGIWILYQSPQLFHYKYQVKIMDHPSTSDQQVTQLAFPSSSLAPPQIDLQLLGPHRRRYLPKDHPHRRSQGQQSSTQNSK